MPLDLRSLVRPHLSTIYAARLASAPKVSYRRERWDTPDGDFVDLDFVDGPRAAPCVVLFHGLEGSSQSRYARALMAAVVARGWRGVVPHFRGCSGEPNRLPRAYHSGDSEEAAWMLARLRAASPSPLLVAGVSLGGNVLCKWLGERGDQARDLVAAAASVCAPVDLHAAGGALERGFARVYTWSFLRTLKQGARDRLRRHPGLYDRARMERAMTLRAFDDVVTAPLHGFTGVDDYWTRASSKPYLTRVRVPLLLLNPLDDPFLPAEALPEAASLPPTVTAEYPTTGGHVGFPLSWLPGRLLAFFDEALTAPPPAPAP
jgi:uncharacterized protein